MTIGIYTVIYEKGQTGVYVERDYLEVLSAVSHSSDREKAKMLLLDGEIVIPSGFGAIASHYKTRKEELYNEYIETLESEFPAPWEIDDE